MPHRSTKGLTITVLGALAIVACACLPSAKTVRDTGRWAYLCCTMRFNPSREASDANYDYRDKTVLPAGTQVFVKVDGSKAVFVLNSQPAGYSIEFRYGRKALTASQYFDRLFVAEDPVRGLPDNPALRDAVRDGKLAVGMTKDEAIMARGYPPAHHTPTTDGDDWLYYAHYQLCEQVHFVDGRIASIEQMPPPS
jgi:hypothetical protein